MKARPKRVAVFDNGDYAVIQDNPALKVKIIMPDAEFVENVELGEKPSEAKIAEKVAEVNQKMERKRQEKLEKQERAEQDNDKTNKDKRIS